MPDIPLDLTPAQARAVVRGSRRIVLSEEQALSVRGKLTAAAGAGRKRSDAPRCPCGAMTAARAKARGHKCT